MKILTANFVTCAVKACKVSTLSFPLHFQDAELEQTEMEFNPEFIRNILPRIEWDALKTTAAELGFTNLPETKPEPKAEAPASEEAQQDTEMVDVAQGAPVSSPEDEKLLKDLHTLLMETEVMEGKMVCGNCKHEYGIKDGIANFLLPPHLV